MNTISSEELRTQLQQKEKELYSIQKIGQALSSTLNLDDLLNLIMNETTTLMNADRSTLYLIDKPKKEIWSKIALKAEIKEIRQKFGVGISGYVAETGEKVNITDAYKDSRFDPSTDKRTGYRTRSILCIPVWEPTGDQKSREIMGVIQVLNKKTGPFTEADEGILEAIASEVSIAISNAQLYQQLEKKYREIDLLYEYEQKLSGEYDVQEIFRNMLLSLVQYLKVDRVVLIYPLNNQVYLLRIDREGRKALTTLPSSAQELINIPPEKAKVSALSENGNLHIQLQKYINEDFHLIRYISLSFDLEGNKYALLLLGETSEIDATRDLQMIDIIGQKISRALELNMLREKLLEQERLTAVGQMMSTIVHDLRGPVNNINGFLDLLLEEDTTAEEKEEFSQIMSLELQSITNMTTEILDFAKGKTNILPRKSSAGDVLKRFQPQIEQLFRNTDIDYKIENTSKKTLYIDVEKFSRVLYNIAKNAKEAMKDKGNFFVNCSDQKDQVLFKLTDDGPGIPEEIRDRLFESFVTSGKESGTGLGLAIVQKIVDEHKGKIELQSEVGEGTSFIITLPQYKVNE